MIQLLKHVTSSKIGGKMELIVFQKSSWQLIVFVTRILYAIQNKLNLNPFKHMGQILHTLHVYIEALENTILKFPLSCAV